MLLALVDSAEILLVVFAALDDDCRRGSGRTRTMRERAVGRTTDETDDALLSVETLCSETLPWSNRN